MQSWAAMAVDTMPAKTVRVNRLGTTFMRKRPAGGTALERGEHGTAAWYQGCRCPICMSAYRAKVNAAYRRTLIDRAALYGPSPKRFVSVKPVRARIAELRAAGWTLRAIAKAAGVHEESVRAIATGEGRRCRAYMAEAILGVV